MTRIPPRDLSQIVDRAKTGEVTVEPGSRRVLTDDKKGIGDADADMLLHAVARHAPDSAEAAGALAKALAEPLSPGARAKLSAEQAKRSSSAVKEKLEKFRSEIGPGLAPWQVEPSGLRRPADADARALVGQLGAMLKPDVPVAQRAEALAQRAYVQATMAAYEAMGFEPMPEAGALRERALADIRALTPLLAKLEPGEAHKLKEYVAEALAADWVITPSELQMPRELDRQVASEYASDKQLMQKRFFLPTDDPAAIAQATQLRARITKIGAGDEGVTGLKSLVRDLEAAQQKGGPQSLVASQMLYGLISYPQSDKVEAAVEKAGGWDALLGRDADEARMQIGLNLMEQIDPNFLALYSFVPDKLLYQLQSRPDMTARVATRYLEGFDKGPFPVSFHLSAMREAMGSCSKDDLDGLVSRFARQAVEQSRADPKGRERYQSDLEHLVKDERLSTRAKLELQGLRLTLAHEAVISNVRNIR